jgi:hypothetical protein
VLLASEAHNSTGGQLVEKFQKWLSPPDPCINLNIARKAYHEGTAMWFTQSSIFNLWKSEGSESLLWIHGKRIFVLLTVPWFLLMTPSCLDSGVW